MPDLITQVYFHCTSAENFEIKIQSTNKTYTVSYGYSPKGKVEYEYSCDCPSYKFGKGKYCKHIEQVKASGQHCCWTQFIDGGKPVKNKDQYFCPKCGQIAISKNWAI